jgi:hypothetical protein
MPRRSQIPMQAAARSLPWRVSVLTAAPGFSHQLDSLLAWCRRLPRDRWYFPLPGGRTASSVTDYALWGFAERQDAEAFAALVRGTLGEASGVTVRDARGTPAPPWFP